MQKHTARNKNFTLHSLTWLVFLHMRRQLHGHLTYFLPWGAFLMGVASPQKLHFTTCWSRLPEMSMFVWQTRQVTLGVSPVTAL